MVELRNTASTGAIEGAAENRGRRGIAASFGAIGAALLASLCCIGPVLFVTLGVGAGLASRFEPLRPVFTVLAVALIAVGFYTVYGWRPPEGDASSCTVDGSCAVPRNRSREKILLWIATVVALVLLTFPQWSGLLVR
ncbi:MAG TPA: mercuric transporter MerT family protein [Gemmatimonadaceae bacterium]|nr:mercuric transporter MerT family protein [Gemmatimonadaceae bacterium]